MGSKVANFLKKSERYITSRNGWVSLKGIFRWYECRRDSSTYQNTPGPSGHTNVRWDQRLGRQYSNSSCKYTRKTKPEAI